jgi:butyryl-CoA dehydrogenase
MSYTAPIKDMLFVMHELAGLETIQQLPGCEEATDETVQAVLEENARFMGEVVAPLNWRAIRNRGCNGNVTTSPGFREAIDRSPRRLAGSSIRQSTVAKDCRNVGAACMEMMQAANLSFALCPLLTDGRSRARGRLGRTEGQFCRA